MNFISYIKEASKPGGTPQRYLIWVSFVLFAQTLASVYPLDFKSFQDPRVLLLSVITVLIIVLNLLKSEEQKIRASYCLYIIGLLVCTFTISTGIASLSGIIFMLTWAMTMFIAERREYISFNWVTVFMVLMLITTVILLLFNPTFDIENNYLILSTGAIITSINIYLVYIDFDPEKNFYQEYREIYSNLEKLTFKMSEILSSEGELEVLLGNVAQNCIPYLGLEDCVIYLYDEKSEHLIQVAAYGDKVADDKTILNPILLKPSQGVVGKCFTECKHILVEETLKFEGYVVDDIQRNSELAVPIISNGKVVGVIDSEHSIKGFFKERHLQSFQIIASFCGIKITEQKSRESIELAKAAQEEINRYKELDEMKQRFIANISHDLKTPLSLIKGPAIQINQLSKDSKINSLTNFIIKNTDHLLRVVNQLLQLNRVDEGLNQLYLEKIDTISLLTKIKEQYVGLALEKNIHYTFEFQSVMLISDAFRLEQIIHNLLHNAFRYTQNGGQISLNSALNNGFFEITISDNGPGIPKEIQSKIFDRFFKVNVNNHEGTGIGLSLVKEYVNTLGGDVILKSEIDQGTTFKIKIPSNVKNENMKEEECILDEELNPQSENIKPIMLVVEDHVDLNNFICSYFEQNFQCFSAFDGEDALRQIKKHLPDIIISDLMMPKLDGNKLIDQVKSNEEFAHIPIIILSAKEHLNSKVELYEKGIENYLTKPFDILELKVVVESVLMQRRKLFESFYHKINCSDNPLDGPAKTEKFSPIVKDVLNFILENIENSELNVALICDNLSIGRNRLQKEIKLETGLTPVEFIRSLRLNEAKTKLLDYTQTVSEIAYSVGFNNLSYFSRSFKTEFGVLPSDWQNSIMTDLK